MQYKQTFSFMLASVKLFVLLAFAGPFVYGY